jgi:hypothetical protein
MWLVALVLSSEERVPYETPRSYGCDAARWAFCTGSEKYDDSNDECNEGGFTYRFFIFTHVN